MKNRLPLESALCPETITSIVMLQSVLRVLEDENADPSVKQLAKMGLQLALEDFNNSNPTSN